MPGIYRKNQQRDGKMEEGRGGNGKRVAQEKSKASQLLILSLTSILIPPNKVHADSWNFAKVKCRIGEHTHTNTHRHTHTRTHTWTLYKIVHKRATKGQNRAKNRSKSFGEQLLVTINYMQQFKKKKKPKRKAKKAKWNQGRAPEKPKS